MADFETFLNFKRMVLAPLTRGSLTSFREGSKDSSVQTNCFVSRHDHHNLEIKTLSELGATPSVVETDLYFFIPRTFEISEVGKSELIRDFRSRMRLALPVAGEQGLNALQHALETVANLTGSEANREEILEAIKDLCSIISGTIKHGLAEHSRHLALSHSIVASPEQAVRGLTNLVSNIQSTHDLIDSVRQSDIAENPISENAFWIMDEYISQIYVQYLGTIRHELTCVRKPDSAEPHEYTQARIEIDSLLDRLQEKEAYHRYRFGAKPPEQETELDREQRLVRLSHLKKFFQSKTFVEISREQAAKRFSESAAAAGTACAGIVAAMIERFSRPEVVNVAFQGLFVISFGVIIYVLRDRMKDWAKAHFHETAQKILPDFQQNLMARDKKIGVVKEWFRVFQLREVPSDILELRHTFSSTEMERRLPEDVLHSKKVQYLSGNFSTSSKQTSVSRSLHENTRVNFERYLKHMDDPFKDFTDLDPTGRILRSRSHRVYHFYLCVKNVARPAKISRLEKFKMRLRDRGKSTNPLVTTRQTEQSLVYRIVLDKNGIVRIEDAPTHHRLWSRPHHASQPNN